jgi:hypothetical protein
MLAEPRSFESFRMLYPPRPGGAIRPDTIGRYRGFWAQYKYNDIRNLAYVFPDGDVKFFTRHREPHRLYQLTDAMRKAIRSLGLPLGAFHVLDGGLLYGKGASVRDRLIVWDALVLDGRYLIGTTFAERYRELAARLGNPVEPERETGWELALRVNSHVWLAPVFTESLAERYASRIHLTEIEGLVLKNPGARLERALREENNGTWQIRVRKPHANYEF